MKQLVVGILAHVDAGKTTLSEGMLYCSGGISKLGRVDHKNAFLDHDSLERKRGITIFSKQARLSLPQAEITLLDTPGHVDFSAEMERTLQVLDYAILVISGTDGVQSHTETLWRLLQRYHIPAFLFINKMDLPGTDSEALLQELQKRLHEGCVSLDTPRGELEEQISLCDESLLEQYLSAGALTDREIAEAVSRRKVFPCRFGSALKLEGVEQILRDLERFTRPPEYPAEFGARVYKIARDPQGSRLTYLKVTGGVLRVKDLLTGEGKSGFWEEKADQLRLYSGAKFKPADRVSAGNICAVTGLSQTYPGQGLGIEQASEPPLLQPVLTYQLLLPEGCNLPDTLRRLRQLEEEDPQLAILWNDRLQEIHVQLMGEVQLEVLQSLIRDRFSLDVTFGPESVLYKETIAAPVEGIGHFEPLRHYAEVHLLLEPGERGSGLAFDSRCSTDVLDLSWQRLILTHLEEKQHIGVLTGSPITDMRISLLTGKAHLKHTEGGDFRQATYRAVRQGLRQAKMILLEPYYNFTLRLPPETVGRAMADIQRMNGVCDPPAQEGEDTLLTGYAPVAAMRGYPAQVASYTKGRGRFTCTVRGYEPCHNSESVIASIGYRPDNDVENTADSVFCSHGTGFVVPWDQVPQYMHLERAFHPRAEDTGSLPASPARTDTVSLRYRGTIEEDKELQAIYEQTYGAIKRREFIPRRQDDHFAEAERPASPAPTLPQGPEYLLVDGYNIIFAWDDLKDLARENLEAARQSLADILCNYQGFRKCGVILVFDAYKVQGNPGSVEKYHNIHIVYTKEAETADSYIEKATYEMSRQYRVRVATSDAMEQLIILGHGAQRLSARAFRLEVEQIQTEIADILQKYHALAKKGSTVGQILGHKNETR